MGNENFSQEIKKAEIKRVLRHIGVKHSMARHHAENDNNQFSIFHFAQLLAYEEAMLIVRNIFEEELEEDE